ncbi:MFS transporter [Pseudonocardia endophytica]|uniref:EmrB/QacA subfamily drug resistance transporter n=1 Tax=Pseudonocardia endophytica TaxID=401976 RepID=A0A4R1I1V5_PSEEN|nr:MFS transporter [Pseudonocardia endophytica]TCK27565.1 EmrB/QacA subfamily drug resistance transporter [Pseudonocardia endophytica]
MTAPAPDPRRWLVLVAMTGSLSMIMLDQTVVSVALPTMARELPLTPHGQQWVVNAYVLALAALVALGGRAADLLGRPRAFRIGVSLFFLASAGCAFAWDGTSIVVFRALQGAGAALMMPVSATIVMAAFPAHERGRVMAIYAGISQVFLALGPLVGGLLTEYVTWRAVFLLNVPVGLATLALVAVARVENRPVTGARISVPDVAMVVPGLALLTLGVQQLAGWGRVALVPLAVGLGLSVWFVVRQLRSADPLIHMRLFADRGFTGDAVVMGLVQFGLLGIVLYSSIYLQELLGFGPMAAGLAALPLILPLTLAAQVGGRWFDRSGVRSPVLTGMIVCTVGVVAWLAALPALSYVLQLPGMLLVGVGLGLTLSPTNTDALGRVSDDERSQASGVVQTVRQVGGTLGVAVIGGVVLGVGPALPGRTGTAEAIASGFGVAAVAFGLAALAGAVLLSTASRPARSPDVRVR